jgi:tetratricopeptide (TPR) repeat protein
MRPSWNVVLTISVVLVHATAFASEQSKQLQSRGLVDFHAGRHAEALKFFEQAVKEDPRDVQSRYYRAVTRGRLADFSGAVDDLRAVVAAKPDFQQAVLDLGLMLVQTAEYGDAVKYLKQSQGVAEFEGQASLFLGIAQLRLDDNDAARGNFQRASQHSEWNRTARYYEGVVDYRQGNLEGAKEQFQFVAEADPDSEIGREAAAFLKKMRDAEPKYYRLYGSARYEYDSNVVLAPDQAEIKDDFEISEQADSRFALGVGGTYIPWKGDWLELLVGYEAFQSIHVKLREFNLQDHRPSIQLVGDAGGLRFGLLGRYDYYLLETESFLQEATALPWISVPEGEVGRFEMWYRMRRRDFKQPDFVVRDSFNHAPAVKQVFYLGGTDRYLGVGAQYDREDPVITTLPESDVNLARSFGYNGYEGSIDFGWVFPDVAALHLRYAFRYERYDSASQLFTAEPPATEGVRRLDREHQGVVALRRRLDEHLTAVVSYYVSVNDSKDDRFDYQRHIGSIGVEVSL